MLQQVNLLTDEVRREKDPLTLSQVLISCAGFAVVLGLVSAWIGLSIVQMEAQQASADEQLRLLREANRQLEASAPRTLNPVLEREVAALREIRRDRERVQALLDEYQFQQRDGFSGYFDDLAAHRVSGVWLSEISVQAGGRSVRLKGVATHPGRVPMFLQELSSGGSFTGHLFDGFELKEVDSGLLEFDLLGPEEAG